jgi:hypothetical protein
MYNDTDIGFRPTSRTKKKKNQELRWIQKGVTSADVDEVENNTADGDDMWDDRHICQKTERQ